MRRDKSTEEAAMSRIKSQMPISEKIKYADEIIENSGGLEDMEAKISMLLLKLDSEVKWTWLVDWIVPPVGLASALWTLLTRTVKRYYHDTESDARKLQ